MMNVKNVGTVVGGLFTLTAIVAHAKRIYDLECSDCETKAKIENLENDVVSLEGKIGTLTGEISNLYAQLHTVSERVEKMEFDTEE